MSSLDFDQDAFYICTETSPRCFVVQKAIQFDRQQIERMKKEQGKGGNGRDDDVVEESREFPLEITAPPAPPLPHWFDEECRSELMLAGEGGGPQTPHCTDLQVPLHYEMAVGHVSVPNSVVQMEKVKSELKQQLEYYFSRQVFRENLATDRYLRCQMDADNFVPISIIAGFRKIVQLTNDYALIVQTLRESSQVEVDERGEKVRPVNKRCTIILREMDDSQAQEVQEMLDGGPPYVSLSYGLNNSWYVTYTTEERTQQAYLHLQQQNRRVCARIKTGAPPDTQLILHPPVEHSAQDTVFDLGKVLASLGFVPRATYRPGQTVVRVQEDPSFIPSPSHTPVYDITYNSFRRGTKVRGGIRRGMRGRGGSSNGNSYHYNQEARQERGGKRWNSTSNNKSRHGESSWTGKEEDETEGVEHINFNYEETSFPSLLTDECPIEEKKEKLSFSCVAAGRKEEKKKSYAQSLLP